MRTTGGMDWGLSFGQVGPEEPRLAVSPAAAVASNVVETPTTLTVAELFRAHYDFVWRSLRRLGLTVAEADDGAQSVFLVVSRKLDHVISGKEKAFLFGTAMRVVADVRKRSSRRLEVSSDVDRLAHDAASSEVLLDRARARESLEAAILAMPMDLRAAFVLFELEDFTMAQIAEMLAIPPGTVASRIRRAREVFDDTMTKLKRRFGGHEG